MRYKKRLTYYFIIIAVAVIMFFLPDNVMTQIVVGGAAVFVPIAFVYWVFNELVLGSWLDRKSYDVSSVVKIAGGVAILGCGVIGYGIIRHDLFAAQVGAALVLYAGELFITRQEGKQLRPN